MSLRNTRHRCKFLQLKVSVDLPLIYFCLQFTRLTGITLTKWTYISASILRHYGCPACSSFLCAFREHIFIQQRDLHSTAQRLISDHTWSTTSSEVYLQARPPQFYRGPGNWRAELVHNIWTCDSQSSWRVNSCRESSRAWRVTPECKRHSSCL